MGPDVTGLTLTATHLRRYPDRIAVILAELADDLEREASPVLVANRLRNLSVAILAQPRTRIDDPPTEENP